MPVSGGDDAFPLRCWAAVSFAAVSSEPPPSWRFVVLTLGSAVVAWWALYLGGQEAGFDRFAAKAVASGVAFLAWPMVALRLTGRPLALGGCNRGFAAGVLLYLVIAVGLLCFYPTNPDFFVDLAGTPRWSYLLKVAPVVMAVDFVTKRLVQREAARLWGDGAGEAAQALAWFCGHALELIWLRPLFGTAGSALFIAVTGLATGRLYRRTGNVAGMMLGHWLVSVVMVAVIGMA